MPPLLLRWWWRRPRRRAGYRLLWVFSISIQARYLLNREAGADTSEIQYRHAVILVALYPSAIGLGGSLVRKASKMLSSSDRCILLSCIDTAVVCIFVVSRNGVSSELRLLRGYRCFIMSGDNRSFVVRKLSWWSAGVHRRSLCVRQRERNYSIFEAVIVADVD